MPIVALFVWPFITIAIFRAITVRNAAICALLLGYLFLPEAFAIDVPGFPAINKNFVIVGSLVVALVVFGTGSARKHAESSATVRHTSDPLFSYLILGLIGLLLFNSVLTIVSNREALFYGPRTITALRPWDMVSDLIKIVIAIAPFIIGRRLLSRAEDHRLLLKLLVTMGLLYTVFILIEIRLSPQLHNWVYGFHQHSFLQHIRGGSYRPKVFLQHGLWVGIFLFMVTVAAFALWAGTKDETRTKWILAGVFLLCVLAISRNLGATVIALMILPVLLLGRSLQLRIITVVSIMFLTFPALRQANLVPVDWITSQAAAISEDRAQSFDFRIQHENALLSRAAEKPISGWGGWGRARIYDENGRDISVTDGLWIIILGTSGWLGYIAFFGLLVAPLLFLKRTLKRKPVTVETAALGLIMIGVLIYLVPNSALSPIGWLIAGALAGFVQYDTEETGDDQNDQKTTKVTTTRPKKSYTRYAPKPIRASA